MSPLTLLLLATVFAVALPQSTTGVRPPLPPPPAVWVLPAQISQAPSPGGSWRRAKVSSIGP